MAEIVLFHHVMGLTPGVTAFADQLRSAGHIVHTPDLFDAHTFATLEEGMAHARTVGFDTIIDRGVTVAEALGPELVYAGFSMGVMPAQKLAQTREGARGALFFDSCLPVTEFGDAMARRCAGPDTWDGRRPGIRGRGRSRCGASPRRLD